MKYYSPNYPEESFNKIKEDIERLKNLSNKKDYEKYYTGIYQKIESKLFQIEQRCQIKKQNIDYSLIEKPKNEIISLSDLINDAYQEISDYLQEILNQLKECPYGQKYKNKRNSLDYETCVKELFNWLFIDSWKLYGDINYKQKKLIRDAVYEIEKPFLTRIINNDIKFDYVLIECKNYTNPKYMAMMQIVAYTLLIKDFINVRNPLCLLVSREISSDPFLEKIQKHLFEQKEYLLILCLSDEDLGDMVALKSNGKDPYTILKKKMEEITGISAILNEH